MSRDINYIGMDVHKEAVVIAVLNGAGKQVMESVVETRASSMLQFPFAWIERKVFCAC